MTEWKFRKPCAEDGGRIWELVRKSGVLDVNSVYCYMMLGHYFADTCVVAEKDDAVKGFVTAYVVPERPDTLFVWQIGVDVSERGQGVAGTLLEELLKRDSCRMIRYLETTITPSNGPSRAIFNRLAKRMQAEIAESTGFPSSMFPDKGHEEERLYRVGPIQVGLIHK